MLLLASLCAAGLNAPVAAQQTAAAQPAKAAVHAPSSQEGLKGDHARTRFIIGLERAVEFQVFALTNPNRVFVELPDVRFLLPPHPGDAPIGLIKSFRGGLAGAGKARVVVDVTGPVIVAKSVVEKNKDGTAKLVLEIVPASSVTTPSWRMPGGN